MTNESIKKNAAFVKAGSLVSTVNTSGVIEFMNIKDFPHNPEPIGVRKDDKYDITFYSVPEGITVPAYNEETHSVIMAPVAGWSEHRGLEMEIVKLSSGKQILTDDDPRAVYGVAKDDPNMELKRFTPSEALAHKVLVPAVYKQGTPRFDVDRELSPTIWRHEFNEEKDDHVNIRTMDLYEGCADLWYDLVTDQVLNFDELLQLECNLSEDPAANEIDHREVDGHAVVPMDFEFGQFLGCLVGDGWWDHKDYVDVFTKGKTTCRKIYLADNEGENAAFVAAYITERLAKDVHVSSHVFQKEHCPGRYGDTVRYTYMSPRFTEIAKTLDIILGGERDERTAGSGNKHLPSWIAAAPREVKLGFLAGIISTDGSVSVSQHKGEDRSAQLLVNITSTSLHMLEDLQGVLRTIDITSNIGFSKITTAGNVSWVLTICTPELKDCEAELEGMCNKRKLNILKNTAVTLANNNYTGMRRVLFPDVIADLLLSWTPQPKLRSVIGTSAEPYARRCSQIAGAIRRGKEFGYVTEKAAKDIIEFMYDHKFSHSIGINLKEAAQDIYARLVDWKEVEEKGAEKVRVTLNDMDFELLNEAVADLASLQLRRHEPVAEEVFQAAYKILRGVNKKYMTIPVSKLMQLEGIGSWAMENLPQRYFIFTNDIYIRWEDMARGGFTWDIVEEVIKTGIVETGYDLTVPGYETFMGADGVIRSNTINVHVPASDAAVKEAKEKLMPSTFPFSNRDMDKIVPLPKQEQILGLYTSATAPATTPIDFPSEEDAIHAIRSGQVPLSADITIRGKA